MLPLRDPLPASPRPANKKSCRRFTVRSRGRTPSFVPLVGTRIPLEWGLSDSKHALTSEPENHFCYSQSMVSGLGASPIARRRYRQQFVGIASGIALVYLSAFVTMWWWESGNGPSPSGALQLIAMGVLVACRGSHSLALACMGIHCGNLKPCLGGRRVLFGRFVLGWTPA